MTASVRPDVGPPAAPPPISRRGRQRSAAALAVLVTCSLLPPATAAAVTGPPEKPVRGHGSVTVLYAGSLVTAMTGPVAAGFTAATGYGLSGYPAGSDALKTQIRDGVERGDVFISADPTVDDALEKKSNGSWVSWYITFATSPLLIGYDPASPFAHLLRTLPWTDVVTRPGFRLGRTDPATDPKGRLAVRALDGAARRDKDRALSRLATDDTEVFPEETLLGRLTAGQLDAGFFYEAEAKAAGIPTVPLGGPALGATYTVTVLSGAPNRAGAIAFVSYLLGRTGRAVLRAHGVPELAKPVVHGTRSALPAALRHAVAGP